MELLTINQGLPSQKFFMLAQPHNGNNGRISISKEIPKPVYELKNPKTGQTAKAELYDYFVWELHEVPDSWCLLAYGLNSAKLVPLLMQQYPEFQTQTQVEFLLLKKL